MQPKPTFKNKTFSHKFFLTIDPKLGATAQTKVDGDIPTPLSRIYLAGENSDHNYFEMR